MRVKMLVGLSGPTLDLQPGDEYDCDDREGQRLICARYAVPVNERRIERAVQVPAPETRTKRKGK